jgi:hypothetical protein
LVLFLGESNEKMQQYYKKPENDNISGCEVAEELDILVDKMKNRRDEKVCISKHVSLLSDFEDHL